MKKSATAFLLIALLASAGCHSTRRGEPITGPMNLNAKEQRGRVVFQMRCDQCHPNGESGLGPALNNKPAPVFLMKTQVRLGLGAMPRFDKHTIPPDELDDLMAYVMALRKADKPPKDNKEELEQLLKTEKHEHKSPTPLPAPVRPQK
jgi:mono/diheme cytochrome c family protein